MHDLVFLFDVDNTLLDNDHVQRDLSDHLATNYGQDARDRYFAPFEELQWATGSPRFSHARAIMPSTLRSFGSAGLPTSLSMQSVICGV